MKPYLVFTCNLGVELQGKTPRPGKMTNFENIDEAREFAGREKDRWQFVCIYERVDLKAIEHYLYGRKYIR
jgi:hypothetical protein